MKKKISIFLVSFLMLFNIYQIDYNTKKIEINKPVEAIEPLTAYFISSAIAGLALSLGFQLVNSTSDSFTQGCMTLYNNFTTNTRNLIDRIAGKKQSGDSTYDVTPAELESFGNELSSSINDLSNGGQFLFKKEYTPVYSPDLTQSISINKSYETFSFSSGNFEKNVYYKYYAEMIFKDGTVINSDSIGGGSYLNNTTFIKFDDNGGILYYYYSPTYGYRKYSGPYTSFNIKYIAHNSTGLFFDIGYPWSLKKKTANNHENHLNVDKLTLQVGDEIVQEPPVINVGQMNISELIAALQASGALNSQGAVTQQFITNYDTAVPADIYTDINAKTVVDTLYDGADTNVPEVPQDWSILQSMYQVLRDLYQNVRTGINSLSNTLSQVLTNVKAIPQTISTTLTSLFVPPDGFMNPIILDFENRVSAKIGKPEIDLTSFAVSRIPEDINITIMGQNVTVFKAEPLIYIADKVRAWIIGFLGIMALIFNYNNIFRLISSRNYTEGEKAIKGVKS